MILMFLKLYGNFGLQQEYFNGDKNNMPVFVKVNDENKSCGQIYVTEDILDIFRGIIGEENVLINEE